LRDRVTEARDEDGLAGFLDLFEDGEAGGFEFRDGDFFHGTAPSGEENNMEMDHSQTIV
jgi:hypothetical protein